MAVTLSRWRAYVRRAVNGFSMVAVMTALDFAEENLLFAHSVRHANVATEAALLTAAAFIGIPTAALWALFRSAWRSSSEA